MGTDTDTTTMGSAARNQLMLVRRRAQPAAAYITRLTGTAVLAYLLALLLPGSSRPVLAPLTALLVVQATLFQTIRSAIQRVGAVTAGVLTAVAVAAYVPFSWWVLGLLTAGTLALGMTLRLGNELLEVPISAMLIFSVDTHAAAASRITDTLVGTAAGLAAGLVFAPLRVQSAKDAVGDITRQMSELLDTMAEGLADVPDPRRASEWLEGTRALRGEIGRLDEALSQAEDSVRLNPRRLLLPNPAAGLRERVDTLERAATDMRVLARAVADSARIDSDDSPVRDEQTRAQLAATLGELSAAVRAYGQLVEAPTPTETAATRPALSNIHHRSNAHHRSNGHHIPRIPRWPAASASELRGSPGREGPEGAFRPGDDNGEQASQAGGLGGVIFTPQETLREHLAEAHRRQDDLADLLRTDPEEQPDGWPLRGELLAHVDRLRTELEPGHLGPATERPPLRGDSTGPMRVLRRNGPRLGAVIRRGRRLRCQGLAALSPDPGLRLRLGGRGGERGRLRSAARPRCARRFRVAGGRSTRWRTRRTS